MRNFLKYDINDSFFLYNMQNLKDLDINEVKDDNIVVFPRNIYQKEALAQPNTVCSPYRDPEFFYLYGREVKMHPDYYSKYDYGRCFFGWCYGSQSGRNYQCIPYEK